MTLKATASIAAAVVAREQAQRHLQTLDEALTMFQAQLRAYLDHGLKAEAEVVRVRIARTEALIRDRRRILEGRS